MTDNVDKWDISTVGNPLYADLLTSTENVYLNARYKVATKCSTVCRNFRFGTDLPSLSAGFTSIYQSIRNLAWTGGLGALVCILAMIYVIYMKSKATQKMYVNLFILSLVLCLVCWIMISVYLSRANDVMK